MAKTVLSVYVDNEIRNKINKEVAEINLRNPSEKRIKVSNIIEDIIIKYYSKKPDENTITIGR